MHLYERRHSLDLGEISNNDVLSLKSTFGETLPGRIELPPDTMDPVTAATVSPLMVKVARLNEQHGALSLVWTSRPCSNALHIRKVHGENLAKLDLFTESDPYCEIQVISDGEVVRQLNTSIITNEDEPVWTIDESIVLAMGDTIRIDVYDFDRVSTDDILGFVELDPFEVKPGPGVPTTIDVDLQDGPEDEDVGSLSLEVVLLGLQCVADDEDD